jgi:hypothetical protein
MAILQKDMLLEEQLAKKVQAGEHLFLFLNHILEAVCCWSGIKFSAAMASKAQHAQKALSANQSQASINLSTHDTDHQPDHESQAGMFLFCISHHCLIYAHHAHLYT